MSTKSLARFTHKAADFLMIASAIALLMMTFIVGWQVFGRYVLGSSPSWAEQSALTLMIWFIFLGGAAGVRDGFHIRIIAVENMVSQPKGKKMRIMSNAIVGLCGIAMLWWGGELVIRTWSHVIPSLGIPRGMAYLAIPIAGALTALFSLERILGDPAEKASIVDIQGAGIQGKGGDI
jgi:TRAP-type C4-dicarboxylate transport system permease small subunit